MDRVPDRSPWKGRGPLFKSLGAFPRSRGEHAPVFRNAVTVPIIAAALVPEKRVERMGFLGKSPFNVEVVAETDENDALAALWNAIISGVQHAGHETIMQVGPPRAGFMALQPGQMVYPVLSLASGHFRMLQL